MLNQPAPLDLAFQALADPSRRAMVEQLSHGATSVSELAKPLAMSLPAVMQHLSVLESSGLVRTHKVGRVRTCRIDRAALAMVQSWFARQSVEWDARLDRLDRLDRYLETMKDEGNEDGRKP